MEEIVEELDNGLEFACVVRARKGVNNVCGLVLTGPPCLVPGCICRRMLGGRV